MYFIVGSDCFSLVASQYVQFLMTGSYMERTIYPSWQSSTPIGCAEKAERERSGAPWGDFEAYMATLLRENHMLGLGLLLSKRVHHILFVGK